MKGWLFPNLQRILGTLGTLSLLLPMVTISRCNSSRPITLNGFQVLTSGWLKSVLVLELVLLLALLALPLLLRGPRLMQLAHGLLLAAPMAAVVAFGLIVPFIGYMFQSPSPELGTFVHAGIWAILYLALWLVALFRARVLFEHRPGWWGLIVAGVVFLAQAVVVAFAASKGEGETGIGMGLVMAPVAVPLALGMIASAASVREKLPFAKVLHAVGLGLVALWVGFCAQYVV